MSCAAAFDAMPHLQRRSHGRCGCLPFTLQSCHVALAPSLPGMDRLELLCLLADVQLGFDRQEVESRVQARMASAAAAGEVGLLAQARAQRLPMLLFHPMLQTGWCTKAKNQYSVHRCCSTWDTADSRVVALSCHTSFARL